MQVWMSMAMAERRWRKFIQRVRDWGFGWPQGGDGMQCLSLDFFQCGAIYNLNSAEKAVHRCCARLQIGGFWALTSFSSWGWKKKLRSHQYCACGSSYMSSANLIFKNLHVFHFFFWVKYVSSRSLKYLLNFLKLSRKKIDF